MFPAYQAHVANLIAPPNHTARNAFFNACRILMNLRDDELMATGVIVPRDFHDDPLATMAFLDDPSADALWAIIQRRQPERYRVI